MTFLNPLLLIGLAAAAVPVLLHLFQLRRPREVAFPSVALLRALQAQTVRRRRLQEWLLLALRVLALACLALGFARPVLEGPLARVGETPASLALVVDTSPSTTRQDGAPLDRLKAAATALAEGLGPGDEVFLVPTTLAAGTRPEPLRGGDALLDAVAALRAGGAAPPLSETVARAAALLDGGRHRTRELYVLSDLQASTLVDSGGAPRVPFDGRAVFVGVGEGGGANVAVTDLRVRTRVVEAGQPVEVEATVRAWGDGLPRTATVGLRLGAQRVAEAPVALRPGGAASVRLRFTPPARGWAGLTAEVAPDAFPYDDRAHAALLVPGVRRVLRVGLASRYVDGVLAPGLAAGTAPFDVDDAPPSALTAERLAAYDAVVLGAVALPDAAARALAAFVRGGGGLLVFAGEGAPALNPFLAALGAGAFATPADVPAGAKVARVDAGHPVFAGVFVPAPGASPVEEVEVRRAAAYRPGGGGEATLVGLTSGGPLVQEVRAGEGRALIVTVAPEPAWSDLPVRGLFVPLVLRGLFYLSARPADAGGPLAAGEVASMRVRGRFATPLVLDAPDGARTTPPQRAQGGRTVVALDGLGPGLYALRAGDSLVARVAVNGDVRESDPRTLALREAARRLADATGVRFEAAAGLRAADVRTASSRRGAPEGREVWNVLFGVALALLVAESLLARRWRSPGGAPAVPAAGAVGASR